MFKSHKKTSHKKEPRTATNGDSTPSSTSFRERLSAGLNKTRQALFTDLGDLLQRPGEPLLEELETRLLMADAGVEATQHIIDALRKSASRDHLLDGLRQILLDRIEPLQQPLVTEQVKPMVILVIGVNGAGKTTTIGKLARHYQQAGQQVMLAAGDTFRAAAVEQLQSWGARHAIPVIAQNPGADSASVIFDAFEAAKSRNIDILLADTAGRLHNKTNLMEELAKIKRVLARLDSEAPHETLLVLDAGTGQNAVSQTRQFNDAIGVTGLALTKLDGTAKGGILFALASQFDIPVRFIGVGEQAEDLRPFAATAFVDALLQTPESNPDRPAQAS